MSDRMTSVEPRDRTLRIGGLGLWGRETRADAISKFRDYYQRELEEAQRALALTDDELVVHTFLGPYAQDKKEEVTE